MRFCTVISKRWHTLGIPRCTVCSRMQRPCALLCVVTCLLSATSSAIAADLQRRTQYLEQADIRDPTYAHRMVMHAITRGHVIDEAAFSDYWRFRVAEFTLHANANKLPKLRKKISEDLLVTAEPAHSKASRTILAELRRIVDYEDDSGRTYSPAARVFAVLAIGDLNKIEPARLGTVPPVPSQDARAVLLRLLTDAYPYDGLHDALRLAAIIGLRRHAQCIQSEEDKQLIALSLREYVIEAARPAQRPLIIHSWLLDWAQDGISAANVGSAAGSQPSE